MVVAIVVVVVVAGSVVVVVVVVAMVGGTVTSMGVVGVVAEVTMTGSVGGSCSVTALLSAQAATSTRPRPTPSRVRARNRPLRAATAGTIGASFTIQVTSCPSSGRCREVIRPEHEIRVATVAEPRREPPHTVMVSRSAAGAASSGATFLSSLQSWRRSLISTAMMASSHPAMMSIM